MLELLRRNLVDVSKAVGPLMAVTAVLLLLLTDSPATMLLQLFAGALFAVVGNGVKASIMLEETGIACEPHRVSFDTDDHETPALWRGSLLSEPELFHVFGVVPEKMFFSDAPAASGAKCRTGGARAPSSAILFPRASIRASQQRGPRRSRPRADAASRGALRMRRTQARPEGNTRSRRRRSALRLRR